MRSAECPVESVVPRSGPARNVDVWVVVAAGKGGRGGQFVSTDGGRCIAM